MTTTTSRRAILAGAAALPALATAALAAPAAKCSFPDLAAELIAIRERWIAQSKSGAAHSKLMDDKILELSGRRRCDWNTRCDSPEFDEWVAVVERASALVPDTDPVDEKGSSITWNEIHGELFPLGKEILAQPAMTVADLGVQAQAFALMNDEVWTSADHENFQDEARTMIDSVCRLSALRRCRAWRLCRSAPARMTRCNHERPQKPASD